MMSRGKLSRGTIGFAVAVALHSQWLNPLVAQPVPVSKGVYRLPFQDGTTVTFVNDHTNHPTTLNRLDMVGQSGGPYTVVAAAAGIIRDIVETNATFCPNVCNSNGNSINDCDGDGVGTPQENTQAQQLACGSYTGPAAFCCERNFEANGGTCPCPPSNPSCGATCQGAVNNYVWIEHPNGEWTKYTHMQTGSIGPGGAGRFVGEYVTAGTPLGLEGDIGLAGGPHVHFEVAIPKHVELPPFDPDPTEDDPDAEPDGLADWFSGGWLRCDECDCGGTCGSAPPCGCLATNVNRQNRIPVFCEIGLAAAGDTNTSGPCDDVCSAAITDLSGTTIMASDDPFYDQTGTTIGNPNGAFVIEAGAGASIRAASTITLSPGFHAELSSSFAASIGPCDSPGGTGE